MNHRRVATATVLALVIGGLAVAGRADASWGAGHAEAQPHAPLVAEAPGPTDPAESHAEESVTDTGDFVVAGPWEGLAAVVVFAAAVIALAYWFRRRERDGDFDPQAPSSAAAPGLRWFFDYSDSGFRNDGSRQRPPRR